MKLAAALAEEALRALGTESEAIARAGGGRGLLGAVKGISPEVRGGGKMQYSLRLPDDAGPLAKVMHYGVQPAFLAKSITNAQESFKELHNITPDKLVAAGFSPGDAHQIYRKAKGRMVGRTAGEAVSWALYPLSIANPALHYPVVGGGAFLAPGVGEALGKKFSG